MADASRDPLRYRRSLVVEPKVVTQFNQFLPSKDKVGVSGGYVPAPLRKKRAERNHDNDNVNNRRSWTGPLNTEEDGSFTSQPPRPSTSSDLHDNNNATPPADNAPSSSSDPAAAAPLQWACDYDSGSSDSDGAGGGRPDPDLLLDDLASRRFHSPSPAPPPTNFAVPISPLEGGGGGGGRGGGGGGGTWPRVSVSPAFLRHDASCLSNDPSPRRRRPEPRPSSADGPAPPLGARRLLWDDSSDDSSDDDEGYADPVQDDLYARRVGASPQPPPAPAGPRPYDSFLPKLWTPQEDAHLKTIRLGSQTRPWYRKMQGFSPYTQQSHTATAREPPPLPLTTLLLERSPYPETFFPRPDPCSGPRLVRGERGALLGRDDPLEPPEPWETGGTGEGGAGGPLVLPDLENDDMFARRTQAFHANDSDLVLLKTPRAALLARSVSEPTVVVVTQPRRPGAGGATLPDLARDDLMYRKTNPPLRDRRRPLSGAPDHYEPMPVPEPWALPATLQARLLCPPCPLTRDAEAENRGERGREVGEGRPTDDMLLRKLLGAAAAGAGAGLGQQGAANHAAPSVPAACSEGDLAKMQQIRDASRLRFKKRMILERLAFLNS